MFRGEKAPKPDNKLPSTNEIEDIFIGTFPLSPGVMTGHYLIPSIYHRWNENLLKNTSVEQIYGTSTPQAPFVEIPDRHRTELSSPTGAIGSFWNSYLDRLFNDRYEGIPTSELVNQLIELTANHDIRFLPHRLKKEASQLDNQVVILSYLKTLTIDQTYLPKYPFYKEHPFYRRLFNEMRTRISFALSQPNRQDEWIKKVNELNTYWNNQVPNLKFFK